ncbi:putative bifunctional diguanylate cyclase/phosphodiesterase [Candidatus Paracaedibacter symbiosus]|uniref:putative bifunctional diguanylate cyclase/phosphodiesterase n=1 Tax=Candidatus Paracaedibacter symbiosus TaxID=244582 RepID=UPI000509CBCF|nr:GGDEF domain-containing phosphodiesterase [Candidatus Paracaedibacter symbiosus]
MFDKLKIIITSENQASHLHLREILSSLTLANFDAALLTRPTIHIDSVFDIGAAEKLIQKNALGRIKYQLLLAEINQFNLHNLQQIKQIQKLDPELFTIIASVSPQSWREVVKFLGLDSRVLFIKTPFNSGETTTLIRNIIYERWLKCFFENHLFDQLQLDHEQETTSIFDLTETSVISEVVHFEEKLSQILSMGYIHRSNTALVCISIEGVMSVRGGVADYITAHLMNDVKERLQQYMAEGWILGFWGQGRFGIIIPGISDHKICEKQLLALNEKLTEIYKIYGDELIISISIGVAFSESIVTSAMELINHAQNAVRMTSPQQKIHIAFYNTYIANKKIRNLMLESELKKAIQEDEFEILFQPIINIKQNRVAGVEVLVRWHHPTLGLLLPYEFLNLAEEANLLIALNELVINKAFAQVKAWLFYGIKVALNIPVEHLLSENFAEIMNALCQKYEIPIESVELEITEEQALEQSLEVIEVIHRIKHHGYQVVLDDFGVGYSSLQYLSNFPVDKIKIDRSFLFINSPKQVNIVKAILALCQKLNIRSVCEGVEEYRQFGFLEKTDCDEIQGFLFSHPLPAENVEPFIKGFSLDNFLLR